MPDQRRGPGRNFLPGTGARDPVPGAGGPFVRVDSGVEQGREIPGDYDSMFAKLIVGEDREEARTRMLRCLDEFVVEGVPTTIPVHRWILGSAEFRAGTHTTTWLERALSGAELPAAPDLSSSTPAPNRPADILVEVDGRRIPVRIFDERREPAPRAPTSPDTHHGEHVHGEILAPMQGTIVKVLVEKGQEVRPGDVICILEAMKMENHVAVDARGRGDGPADPRRTGRRDRPGPRRDRLALRAFPPTRGASPHARRSGSPRPSPCRPD